MSVSSVVFLVVLVVAWLTAAAMAVRSVSRIWLRHWVEQRLNGAPAAALYLERPHRLILAAGTGITLAVFLGGTYLGTVHGAAWGELARYVALLAVAVLVLGQLIPRAVARRWATQLVPLLLPALRLADLVVAPLFLIARGILRVAGRGRPQAPADSSREGLEDLLREGELEGVGEREEIAIITGVVEFGHKTLRDVMTPRPDVFAVDADLPPREMARRIAQAQYSRVPLYRGSLDEVVGMVHVFDVLKAAGESTPPLRPVAFASADRHCNEQLFEMLRARRHLAVVRDAEQRLVGIVTLEDLLEELVGDIADEHDEPAAIPARP